MRCRSKQIASIFIYSCKLLHYIHTDSTAQQMTSTDHLLHTVPVDKGVWVSEVSLVVLVISDNKLATETHNNELTLTFSVSVFDTIDGLRSCLLGLQKKLLIEGLMLVSPFISAAPTGVASISNTTITTTGFKSEVQQVVQAYFFRSRKLSRAKLGPACLCYLKRKRWKGI